MNPGDDRIDARGPRTDIKPRTDIEPKSDIDSDLIGAVAAVEVQHPGLVIDIRHVTGEPTEPLAGLMVDADLLVLGCHHSRQPWSIRTGPVAVRLSRDGRCPLMLVGNLSASRRDEDR